MEALVKRTAYGVLFLLSSSVLGRTSLAQDAPVRSTLISENTTDPSKAAPPKGHKVWTEDDVTTLRTPADQYADEKAAKDHGTAEGATAANAAAKFTAPDAAKPKHNALSNPKSTAEADKMIAWESRDIDAQVDYLNKIEDQLRTASGPERDRLLAEKNRTESILGRSQQELKTLKAQKGVLEKPKPQGNQ